MEVKGIHLSWIVVKNIESAIKFYTEVVGLTLREFSKEYGWAELSGADGARLGIAEHCDASEVPVGGNAVVTITVTDIEIAKNEFVNKNVTLIGDILEVPGHVKLQTFKDADGNTFQLCQLL
jgi:predicted enzyme related to lactoylglutathione lyase